MSTVSITEAEVERDSQRRALTMTVCRAIDLLLAALALLICIPFAAILCLTIRLESGGPAIFRQRRLGRDKRPFTVHKFRTMRREANPEVHREYVEQLIRGAEVTHSNGAGRNLYKLAADDRVTRVGRLLRKTSLDELPQLYDVLRGRMSLVGPRPVIPYEAELYPSSYDRRFEVKPGLTGLWQVNGRSERTYHEMVALDVAWVEHRSIWLYLSILARTPWVLLRRRGAA
jgi:lipopolysaccharide/colanic/teichoic acid biosynthesis glycosyltransferase